MTTFIELYNQLNALIETGDEQAVRTFLVDHLAEFPEDIQKKIVFETFADTLETSVGIAKIRKDGLEAIGQIDKAENTLRDQEKLARVEVKFGNIAFSSIMITLQVGVKAFLRNKDGKYLLLKRSAEKYKNTKGTWDIVGGRIEPGTKLIENLKREISEETGLMMTSDPRLIAAQDIIPNAEKHVVRLSYVADTEGEPVLDTSENVEYKWVSVEELKKQEDLDVYVREIIQKELI